MQNPGASDCEDEVAGKARLAQAPGATGDLRLELLEHFANLVVGSDNRHP
jgi:hypothetical protein